MRYDFLLDTFETEILKVLGVWSMFDDADLSVRPHASDTRGRSVLEHMVHQCASENLWFEKMFGIEVEGGALPSEETRVGFLEHYAEVAGQRLAALRANEAAWWEEVVGFFGERRSRAWIMVRRIAHTSHHRGQQTALLRTLGRDLHSTYGPTADTGGLPKNAAPTIYAYADLATLLREERSERAKAGLPGTGANECTERP